jgi:plastocyanin
MVAITSLLAASAALMGLTSAAPATKRSTGVVHRIFAGSTTFNNGLHFEPENVVAEVGDYIEFHFLAKNHTIVQSSFDKPCEPLANGIFSGFNFKTDPGKENGNVFTFQVQNSEPFWYYCSQTVGNHCQAGMSGVINQNFNSDKTLAAYKEKAKSTTTKQPSDDPLKSNGGMITKNTFLG